MDREKYKWIRVGNVENFPEGEKVKRVVNRRPILVLGHKDRWHAFETLCPHMSRSLQTPQVEGNVLECIWHNMCFNIETGAIVYESGFIGIPNLEIYDIKVKKGEVYVRDEGERGFIRQSN